MGIKIDTSLNPWTVIFFQEAVNHLTKKGLEHMTLKPEVRSKIGEFVSAKKSIFEQEITELMEVMDKVEKEKKGVNSDLLKNIEEINEKILERIAAKTGQRQIFESRAILKVELSHFVKVFCNKSFVCCLFVRYNPLLP